MSNVKSVGSPGAGPEPSRSRRDRLSQPQGFKEAYSKVEKVEEAHPDQPKKKRASKGEEDEHTPPSDSPLTPPTTPFSLDAPAPKDSLVIGASTKQSFSSSLPQGPAASPPTTPPDPELWEEQSPDEETFTPPPYTPPTVGPPEYQYNAPASQQPQPPSQTPQSPTQASRNTQKGNGSPLPPQALSKAASAKRSEQISTTKKVESKEEEGSTMPIEGLPLPTVKPEGLLKQKEAKTAEQIITGGMSQPVISLTPLPLEPPPPLSSTPAPYIYLHPVVLEYFEKTVSTVTVMMSMGITETTVSLHEESSSIFAGAKITIREFTTAPKAFNIEFTANPEAVAIFQSNVDDLMAAFQSGGYNFKVNRIETRIGKPLVRRKEANEK